MDLGLHLQLKQKNKLIRLRTIQNVIKGLSIKYEYITQLISSYDLN